MGTKTGGHWRPCNVGSVEAHNERQQEYLESVKNSGRNLYFFQHLTKNNSSWVNQSERYQGKTVEEIQEKQKELYEKKFGQKPQMTEKKRVNKKTGRETTVSGWSPIREMCPPIKADTKIEDFDYFRQWAERHRLNILRIDLHKDEGYYDEETGDYKMNYHAHVVGDFFDWETGKTIKLGKEVMSEMQTILAISLGMERGERKGADSPNAMTHPEYRKMMELVDEMRKDLKDMAKKKKEEQAVLDAIRAEAKREETKMKSFTTMLKNLKDQKEHLEIEITALEEIRDNGNEEVEQQLKEKQLLLDEINGKISNREEQLFNVQQQLHDLAIRKHDLQKEYDNMKRQMNKELPDLLDKTQSEVNDTFWEMAEEEMKKDYSAINEYISKNLDTKQQGELREIIRTSFFEDLAQRGEQMAACAAALFLGFVDAATNIAHAGGGGGGDTSGWGRNKDEDDEAYRRRCCIMGRMMMKPAGRKLQRGRSF